MTWPANINKPEASDVKELAKAKEEATTERLSAEEWSLKAQGLEAELADLQKTVKWEQDARLEVLAELAALSEKCGKCPICNPGQRNLCGDESEAARAEEGSP
jgi:hypothetical protein